MLTLGRGVLTAARPRAHAEGDGEPWQVSEFKAPGRYHLKPRAERELKVLQEQVRVNPSYGCVLTASRGVLPQPGVCACVTHLGVC